MRKFALIICGQVVQILRTNQRKSHGYLSTVTTQLLVSTRTTIGQLVVIRLFIRRLSTDLYTLKNAISPLLNTICTQFPQPLLLEPQKKI